ncbi:MAG: hypothetical protein RLZZ21_1395 [Planctomycetota bacterium]|jgi:hypothetical protein
MSVDVLLYVSISVLGTRWMPLVRWAKLPAVPRVGDLLCLHKKWRFGEGCVVDAVSFRDDGLVVVEIEGEIHDCADTDAVEIAVRYYMDDLGFAEGHPDDVEYGGSEIVSHGGRARSAP